MAIIVGSGRFTYEAIGAWARPPEGWELGDVAAVAVDRHDRVYVFNRGAYPMMVFDREGRFLTSWGEGVFTRPHGVHMGPDDTIYCTDDGVPRPGATRSSSRRSSADHPLQRSAGRPCHDRETRSRGRGLPYGSASSS